MEPWELAELLKRSDPELLLLDVREDDERATARIKPSLHIPLPHLFRRLGEIPKDRRLVVYCHSGGRSSMVAGFLEGRGYKRVTNLTGGIDAWSREVDPSVPRY